MDHRRHLHVVATLLAGPVLGMTHTAAQTREDGVPSRSAALPARWQVFTKANGIPHDDVRAITVTGGVVWIGTAGGPAWFEDGAWRCPAPPEGGPWPAVSDFAFSTTGETWLGTWGDGLLRHSGGRWDRFDQLNSGLAGNLVFAVRCVDGRVWAATNAGLSELDPRRGTWALHFGRRGDAPETAVVDLEVADDGTIRAAAWCAAALRLGRPSGVWTALAGGPGLLGSAGDTLAGVASADGTSWWATQDRLLVEDETGWSVVPRMPADEAGPSHVTAVAAGDGLACLATDAGLEILIDRSTATWVRHDRASDGGGRVTVSRAGAIVDRHARSAGLPHDRVRCVAVHDGVLWVGTAGGLARGIVEAASPSAAVSGVPPHDLPWTMAAAQTAGDERIGIGILRPAERMISVPGSASRAVPGLGPLDRMAAMLAIEQANARGGYRGRPYALVTGPTGSFRGWGWTTPEDDLIALARRADVVGTVASIGAGCHFTSAATSRTDLPVVNCAPRPAGPDAAASRWLLRTGNEPMLAHRRTLDEVFDTLGCARPAVLRTPGAEAAARLDAWRDQARRRGHPLVADVPFDPGVDDLAARLEAIRDADAQVVLTWGDGQTSAGVLRAMHDAGMDQVLVVSSDLLDEMPFAASDAHPRIIVTAPAAAGDQSVRAAQFAEDYETRFRRRPAAGAYSVFAAVKRLVAAVDEAGPDREAVRRVLARGVTGRVAGSEPVVHHFANGAWRPLEQR